MKFIRLVLLCFTVLLSQGGVVLAQVPDTSSQEAASAPDVSGQDAAFIRIALVRVDRLLRDSEPAKAGQKRLEQEFSKREKELQELATRLKEMKERVARDLSVLSESERGRHQREIEELDRLFQRRQRETSEDYSQRRSEEVSKVIDLANQAIQNIANQEKYDLVIQDAIVASHRVDITNRVLQALSRSSSGRGGAPSRHSSPAGRH